MLIMKVADLNVNHKIQLFVIILYYCAYKGDIIHYYYYYYYYYHLNGRYFCCPQVGTATFA